GLDEVVDGKKNVIAGSGKQLRSGHVDGDLVSAADRYLIDTSVADVVNAGRNRIVRHERRPIRNGAGEYVVALVRSVGQGHKLALNALQLIGNGGEVASGERATAGLDAEAEGLLQRAGDRTQRRIGGRELALHRAEALQIAVAESGLIVVLDQLGGGGRIVGGLVHAFAGRNLELSLLCFQLCLVERRQQFGHGIRIHAHGRLPRNSYCTAAPRPRFTASESKASMVETTRAAA